MAVNLAPQAWIPSQDANGDPYSGALLFTYAEGSTTKLATYTDATGSVAQANPIVLNTRGLPDDSIWLTEGRNYKFVLAPSTDTDPPTSPIKTEDNIVGINDATAVSAADQWTASGLTPTYINATSFSLEGDQTSTFHVNRRVKTTNSGGTIYSTISAVAYTSLTTVTVVNDSGTLDAGLSDVDYGFLSATNISIPDYTLYDDSVNTVNIVADAVTTAKIPDNAITLAKMAGGTAGHLISYDSSGDPQTETYTKRTFHSTIDLTNGGANDTASWTFSSIPASATKLEICFSRASLSGTDNLVFQIGDSGGAETTGYISRCVRILGASVTAGTTAWAATNTLAAGDALIGAATVEVDTGNNWIFSSHCSEANDVYLCTGDKTLSGTLTQLVIRSSGTDNFDGGSATLYYYGNADV